MSASQLPSQEANAAPKPFLPPLGEYQRRRPEQTVLYQCVQENYRSFLAVCEEQDRVLPAFVRREFEKYLECGILAHGFARVHCGDCGYDRLCAFSCKRRGWCPGCLGRRMSDGAAYLVDCVFGDTRVRHWVLSLPPPLRHLLAYDPSLVSEVLSAFLDSVFQCLRWQAKRVLGLASVTDAFPGAVTAIQRCSGHLALNPHFHSLVTDGVFVEDSDGSVVFRELPAPTDEQVTRVASETCRRTLDILRKRGLWQDEPEAALQDVETDCDPTLAELYAASLRGVISMGPRRGQRVVRFFGAAAASPAKAPEVPGAYGFDLHAREAIRGGNREALERLARYILRPPLAQARLERGPQGSIVLHMKRAWRDGTTAVAFEPLDFMAKLAALVPRPRQNTLRFHGVYAPNARLRSQIVLTPHQAGRAPCSCGPVVPSPESNRLCWAELMRRIWAADVFTCGRCGSSNVRRIAWITDPQTVSRILSCIGLPRDGPVAYPPRDTEEFFAAPSAA